MRKELPGLTRRKKTDPEIPQELQDRYGYPALDDSAGRGDEHTGVRDHGSLETNYSWVQQGFRKNRVTGPAPSSSAAS